MATWSIYFRRGWYGDKFASILGYKVEPHKLSRRLSTLVLFCVSIREKLTATTA